MLFIVLHSTGIDLNCPFKIMLQLASDVFLEVRFILAQRKDDLLTLGKLQPWLFTNYQMKK